MAEKLNVLTLDVETTHKTKESGGTTALPYFGNTLVSIGYKWLGEDEVGYDFISHSDNRAFVEDGWFETGDVATIDSRGNVSITDRTKDVIKSGGEWISSIEIENCATGHPQVAEAAVIGRNHPKWGERPLLIIVKSGEDDVAPDELKGYLDGKIAKWWMPDDVQFIDEMPHTATGKIQKMKLREMFDNYQFPA